MPRSLMPLATMINTELVMAGTGAVATAANNGSYSMQKADADRKVFAIESDIANKEGVSVDAVRGQLAASGGDGGKTLRGEVGTTITNLQRMDTGVTVAANKMQFTPT